MSEATICVGKTHLLGIALAMPLTLYQGDLSAKNVHVSYVIIMHEVFPNVLEAYAGMKDWCGDREQLTGSSIRMICKDQDS